MSRSTPPVTAQARPIWSGGLLYYEFPLFDPFRDRFTHGFSTRLGGVSQGNLASLNLGISRGDVAGRPEENFRRWAEALGVPARRAVMAQQTHTVNLRRAGEDDAGKGWFAPRDYQDIDGLYTTCSNLPLTTHHADCPALLFYAADIHAAAASHAGWRGTTANMAGETVAALIALGADPAHIYAAVSPSAGPCCYQVDEKVAQPFLVLADEEGPCARPDPAAPGRYLADLPRANRVLLLRAGLLPGHIAISGLCTICRPDIFYSHRVLGEDRGSMAALVMLK